MSQKSSVLQVMHSVQLVLNPDTSTELAPVATVNNLDLCAMLAKGRDHSMDHRVNSSDGKF